MTKTFSRSFALILSAAMVTSLWVQTLTVPASPSHAGSTIVELA